MGVLTGRVSLVTEKDSPPERGEQRLHLGIDCSGIIEGSGYFRLQ